MLSEQGVTVTNRRLVVGGDTTYALPLISSVRFERLPPPQGAVILLTVLALGGFLAGHSGAPFGLVMLILLVLALALRRTRYRVLLTTAAGEQPAVSSTDEAFIRRLVTTLTNAIAVGYPQSP